MPKITETSHKPGARNKRMSHIMRYAIACGIAMLVVAIMFMALAFGFQDVDLYDTGGADWPFWVLGGLALALAWFRWGHDIFQKTVLGRTMAKTQISAPHSHQRPTDSLLRRRAMVQKILAERKHMNEKNDQDS